MVPVRPALRGPIPAVALAAAMVAVSACGSSTASRPVAGPTPSTRLAISAPNPDPRVGLRAGLQNAAEAVWNLRVVSKTPAPKPFAGATNSDLAFTGHYAIQGNYNGFQIWDISNPARPVLRKGYYCPASQSDVSVFGNLLFVSGEGLSGRIDCGGQGVQDTVSKERLRGIRIFDISDLDNPNNVGNVQTCRGSHTHTVLADPNDTENVYIYISGSSRVRSPNELPGCVDQMPEDDPNSAHFRIEVIKVPLAHPERAAIVSSPRIFDDLAAPPSHGASPEDIAAQQRALQEAKARGGFVYRQPDGTEALASNFLIRGALDSIARARGGSTPNAADSAALRQALPQLAAAFQNRFRGGQQRVRRGPDQCHDITVYPAIGFAGGACAGYGFLIDIRDPARPVRIDAVADSNFSYWHSATFNNDGTKILFSDEWGGGGQPKCRANDPKEWGADALFTLSNRKMTFQSYYKLPAPQTSEENCVAHNGSLIPIPGRDVMVQAWYQGGISVFDWTDVAHPVEIAYFDRGPIDANRMVSGGSWSVYWYNGVIVSSEIARGLDIFELIPSPAMTQNEIDAAKTVKLDYLNTQGQPKFMWPASFPLARAYLDQLQRSGGLDAARLAAVRQDLAAAERQSGADRSQALSRLAGSLTADAGPSADGGKVRLLAEAVRGLAAAR